jgi:MFS family permease
VRRRPLRVGTDLAGALLIATVPLAALGGWLTIEHLLTVALLVGALATLARSAGRAFLVAVVSRERLVQANSRLAASRSAIQVVGPGIGGALVQALTAPIVLAVDSVSLLLSGLLVAAVRVEEPPAPPRPPDERLRDELRAGLRFLLAEPTLRRLAVALGFFELCDSAFFGLYVLYVTTELGVGPAELGLIFALGGAGGVVGAILAERASARLGLGRALVLGVLLPGLGDALIPWAGVLPGLTVPVLAVAELLVVMGVMLFMVNHSALVQRITPDHLLGRVGATDDALGSACSVAGALIGGAAAGVVGVRPLLIVAASATLLAGLWLLRSHVWELDRPAPRARMRA